MGFKKVTVTVPDFLYGQASALIDKGIFANFSDLVRDGIRKELKEEAPLAEKAEKWKAVVHEFREGLKKSELAKLSKEELMERLRKTRELLWDEKYEKIYEKALSKKTK